MSKKEILDNINRIAIDLDEAVDQAVRAGALAIQNEAIASINTQSRGEKVTRYGPKRQHTVSKPGDAPNTDTGRLIGSIEVAHDKGSKRATVFSDLDYALHLETVHDRPFLEPAAKAERKNILNNVKQAVEKVLK